jgi:Uma2 family endonuclease
VSQARIDALTDEERAGFRPLSSDVAMDVNSASDNFKQTVRKTRFYMRHGSTYAVAIDPATRKVVQLGNRPHDLALDIDTIIDA